MKVPHKCQFPNFHTKSLMEIDSEGVQGKKTLFVSNFLKIRIKKMLPKSLITYLLSFIIFLLPVTDSTNMKIRNNYTIFQGPSRWSSQDEYLAYSSILVPTVAPIFDTSTPTNVTVTASKTAVLSCIVHNLGNNTVSWIRHRDLHILSVAKVTYTNDDRFKVVPRESIGDWALRIRYATPRDTGQYDCQVSTRPPIAHTLHLIVIEPKSRILRAPEMHVGAGSLINLTCVISYSPEPPEYLYWYHKERMVRGDGSRIIIDNQLGTRSVSQLVVKNANSKDSGVYTCSPAHARESTIIVHVVTDGYPAAMQGGSSVILVGHRKLLCLMVAPIFIAATVSYFYM